MTNVFIDYNNFNVKININLKTNTLIENVDNSDAVKYLKGIFTNKSRFKSRFIDKVLSANIKYEKERLEGKFERFDHVTPNTFECTAFMEEILDLYDKVEPFTYLEAFKLQNRVFQIEVFGSIDISEMISELGHERIKVDGKLVKHKQFNKEGEFIGYKEYNNVYETYKVFGQKLELEEDVYAIKCWCTTTDEEHWLWIEDTFKDEPLEAIASTFRIHENLIPHIKELKRQGDVLLVEMNKESENLTPEGEMVPLNSEQYFSLLTAQS